MITRNGILLFIYALLQKVKLPFVGNLMLSEVLVVLALPFIGVGRLYARYPVLKWVSGAYGLLLASLVVSDMINGTLFVDYARGWASIVVSFLAILFIISQLDRNTGGIVWYLLGSAVAMIAIGDSHIDSSGFDLQEASENIGYFKFQAVPILNALVAVAGFWLFRRGHRKYVLALLFVYTLVCFVFGARSTGLIFMIATVVLLPKVVRIKVNRSALALAGVVAVALMYGAYVYYVNLVLTEGFGGSNAVDQLTRAENPYNPFELLKQGRTETFIAVEAIRERPLEGYGSWAKDPTGKFRALAEKIRNTKSDVSVIRSGEAIIPSHSILLTAWLWAGIGGLIAIVWIFWIIFRCMGGILRSRIVPSTLPMIIVLGVELVWHLFFSPFSHIRTTVPLAAALMIVEYYNLKRIQAQPANETIENT